MGGIKNSFNCYGDGRLTTFQFKQNTPVFLGYFSSTVFSFFRSLSNQFPTSLLCLFSARKRCGESSGLISRQDGCPVPAGHIYLRFQQLPNAHFFHLIHVLSDVNYHRVNDINNGDFLCGAPSFVP